MNTTNDGKSQTLKAQYHKNSVANFVGYTSTYGASGVAENVIEIPQDVDLAAQGIYQVENGQIEVKGKKYPLKLKDGFYRIRKLTVRECMRLQTVPEWYAFPVSNSQAYKMLGNGWTIEVIKHLIQSALADNGSAETKVQPRETISNIDQLEGQMNIYDFIGA